jgi:hypothetical protein
LRNKTEKGYFSAGQVLPRFSTTTWSAQIRFSPNDLERMPVYLESEDDDEGEDEWDEPWPHHSSATQTNSAPMDTFAATVQFTPDAAAESAGQSAGPASDEVCSDDSLNGDDGLGATNASKKREKTHIPYASTRNWATPAKDIRTMYAKVLQKHLLPSMLRSEDAYLLMKKYRSDDLRINFHGLCERHHLLQRQDGTRVLSLRSREWKHELALYGLLRLYQVPLPSPRAFNQWVNDEKSIPYNDWFVLPDMVYFELCCFHKVRPAPNHLGVSTPIFDYGKRVNPQWRWVDKTKYWVQVHQPTYQETGDVAARYQVPIRLTEEAAGRLIDAGSHGPPATVSDDESDEEFMAELSAAMDNAPQ